MGILKNVGNTAKNIRDRKKKGRMNELINIALTDDVLTEKEKQTLFKRAQQEGIDLDEFEMVLDARIHELKKNKEKTTQSAAPKSKQVGNVRKCPNCGTIVPPLSVVCIECGYEFSNVKASSSYQELMDKIEKILEETKTQKMKITGIFRGSNLDSDSEKRIRHTIKNFPIPISKPDLFDFITSLEPRIQSKFKPKYNSSYDNKDDTYDEYQDEYYTLYNQACIKAESLFPDDPQLKTLVENRKKKLAEKEKIEKEREEKKQRAIKLKTIRNYSIIIIIAIIILIVLYSVIW